MKFHYFPAVVDINSFDILAASIVNYNEKYANYHKLTASCRILLIHRLRADLHCAHVFNPEPRAIFKCNISAEELVFDLYLVVFSVVIRLHLSEL